ncbi:hypothetical protein [Stenotrophomonas sp. Nf1]|uniref:hypothetical protein n=2 Tax=unclassified Stenotrophomonas TaxID=196198 RepID=UPI0011B249D0|nr:hypothetical protein [Stenotrophomonas sp. Nf1]
MKLVNSMSVAEMTGVSLIFDGEAVEVSAAGSRRIDSVWFRRPGEITLPHSVAESDIKFVEAQWRQHIHGVCSVSPRVNTFWVNSPKEAMAAESKAYQLLIASKVGFSIPRTIISCDPAEIRKFVGANGACVFKSFSPFAWVDSACGSRRITVAQEVDASMLSDDRAIEVAPGIYQKKISKRYELRVTVIGRRQFAVRMSSKSGHVDWRGAIYETDSDIRSISLSVALSKKISDLMAELGLVYGAIDLGVDENGDVYFFEINQGGQFLHIEECVPELPLLACFTSLFVQGRPDYEIIAPPSMMSLAAYRGDDCYLDWRSEFEVSEGRDSPYVSYLSSHNE